MNLEQMEELFRRSFESSGVILTAVLEKGYSSQETINGLGIVVTQLMLDLEFSDDQIVNQMRSWIRMMKNLKTFKDNHPLEKDYESN